MHNKTVEKSNNFGKAIGRLIKELNKFIIYLCLIKSVV